MNDNSYILLCKLRDQHMTEFGREFNLDTIDALRAIKELIANIRSEARAEALREAADSACEFISQHWDDAKPSHFDRLRAAILADEPKRSPEVMPSFMVYRDGDMFCAVNGHFRNLQESASGWGRTPVEALVDLIEGRAKDASPEVILADEPKESGLDAGDKSL